MAIKFYTVPTANGERVRIALEELGLPYELYLVDMAAGEHREPSFLALSPFGRAPVIVDYGPDGPFALAETSAILIHLAERAGRLLPADATGRLHVVQWVAMIAANAAPAFRGEYHFGHKSGPQNPGAYAYFEQECAAALAAIERAVTGRHYLVGDALSIADIQCFPLLATSAPRLREGLERYPALRRYRDRLAARPGFRRGMAWGGRFRNPAGPMTRCRWGSNLFERSSVKCVQRDPVAPTVLLHSIMLSATSKPYSINSKIVDIFENYDKF